MSIHRSPKVASTLFAAVFCTVGCDNGQLPTAVEEGAEVSASIFPALLMEANPDLAGQMDAFLGAEAEARARADASARRRAEVRSSGVTFSIVGADIEVPGDYATIQEAVDNASPGDKIEVSGTTVEPFIFVTVPGVALEGEEGARIEGVILRVLAPDVTISGFELNIRVWTDADNTVVSDNDFIGINGIGSMMATLGLGTNATFRDNTARDASDGVFLIAGGATVEDLMATDMARSGVIFSGSDGNSVTDCTLTRTVIGLRLGNANDNVVADCLISDSPFAGANLSGGLGSSRNAFSNLTLDGNDLGIRIAGPESADNVFTDVTVQNSGTCDVIDFGTNTTFVDSVFGSFNC